MDPQKANQESLADVIQTMGAVIGRQARGRWDNVQTARRKEGGRQVWRFRTGSGASELFLHVPRLSMTRGNDPAAALLAQLADARWLDRLQDGPETSYLLSPAGRLNPWHRS
ncbi:hypothetical protein BH23GEM6_BH23GEM6_13100 [soil metagenome]